MQRILDVQSLTENIQYVGLICAHVLVIAIITIILQLQLSRPHQPNCSRVYLSVNPVPREQYFISYFMNYQFY